MSETGFEDTDFRDFRVPEEKHELYVELSDTEMSPLHEADMFEIFLLAFGYGCRKAGREPFKGGKSLFNRSTLDEQTQWIIKAVAVNEVDNPDILIDDKKIREIAEEYACGGITELHSNVFAPGDGLIKLSDDLLRLSEVTE
jgi:hypothetical protein